MLLRNTQADTRHPPIVDGLLGMAARPLERAAPGTSWKAASLQHFWRLCLKERVEFVCRSQGGNLRRLSERFLEQKKRRRFLVAEICKGAPHAYQAHKDHYKRAARVQIENGRKKRFSP